MIGETVQELATLLPASGVVLVEGGPGASDHLADAIEAAGDKLGALTFTGVQVPGINRRSWRPNAASRFDTFFMTPELSRRGGEVRFLPFSYLQIGSWLRRKPIAAALFSVTPPDEAGMCSFGPTVDFLAELWPEVPVRIAHVNPLLPRTEGPCGIPAAAFKRLIETPQPLVEMDDAAPDAGAMAIARQVAAFIDDGATLQLGLGKLPGAVLRALTDRRRLRIHSGLIGDGVIDLLEAGAIPAGGAVTTGVAIGTRRLYDALPGSGIAFRPVSHTHDWATIAAQPRFVSINSALEVDLLGQGYSEAGPSGWTSGAGGVTDFARGAALGGGLRIVALPATAKGASRIVHASGGRGPVSLARGDIDIVVTEHGAADLRGRTHNARAAALIGIAAPDHREALAKAWRDGPGSF